jgi:hypothetical protein
MSRFLRFGQVYINYRNLGTRFSQGKTKSFADTLSASRNQSGLSVQPEPVNNRLYHDITPHYLEFLPITAKLLPLEPLRVLPQ